MLAFTLPWKKEEEEEEEKGRIIIGRRGKEISVRGLKTEQHRGKKENYRSILRAAHVYCCTGILRRKSLRKFQLVNCFSILCECYTAVCFAFYSYILLGWLGRCAIFCQQIIDSRPSCFKYGTFFFSFFCRVLFQGEVEFGYYYCFFFFF